MEVEKSCFMAETVVGELIAGQSSFEFAELFLLVGGPRKPRAGHVFEEFKDVLSIFRNEDVRLSSLIA